MLWFLFYFREQENFGFLQKYKKLLIEIFLSFCRLDELLHLWKWSSNKTMLKEIIKIYIGAWENIIFIIKFVIGLRLNDSDVKQKINWILFVVVVVVWIWDFVSFWNWNPNVVRRLVIVILNCWKEKEFNIKNDILINWLILTNICK